MKRKLKKLLLLLLLSNNCLAALTTEQENKIADAIYRAEGGKNAKVPYGILSHKVSNESQARRVCLNSIRNNYTRWENAGKTNSFITFMGLRYAPPSNHPLNRYWVKNVESILGREFLVSISGKKY